MEYMNIIVTISYIFIALLVYTILRFIETNEDCGLHMMYSIFWPVIIISLIIIGPFYLIDILVKRIKINKKKVI